MPSYSLINMCRYAGGSNPTYGMRAAMMMPMFGYGYGGGMNSSIARVCYRAGYYEMTYGPGRNGGGGYMGYARMFAQSVQRTWPTFAKAEGAGKGGSGSGSGSAAPAKGAGGTSGAAPAQAKPKAEGAEKKETPEEAEAKADEKRKKERIKKAESDLKKAKKNAVSNLVKSKGYSRTEAEEVVKVINASVETNHGGDPDKAEAIAQDYVNYLNTVPHKETDKKTQQPYKMGAGDGSWANAYTKWLAGMKKIQPPERALHAVGDVKRALRRGKFAKGTPNYAVLERIGTRQDALGNTYDAFTVRKSGDSRVAPDSIIVRRKDKWYMYDESTKTVTPLKAGRRTPEYDAKLGILNLDRRGRKLVIKMKDALDAKAINDSIDHWMKERPKVMSKDKIGEERAAKVKDAIEAKLKKYFGGKKLATVTTEGKDVKIVVVGGTDAERNENARKVAAALKGNEGYFRAVFDDMAPGSFFDIGDKHRVAARDTTSFNRVVGALRKLPTETTVAPLDMRKFDASGGDETPTYADMDARVKAHLPNAVAGDKVVVALRFIEGNAPKKDSDDWKKIVKDIKAKYAKKGRTVEVKQVTVKDTADVAYTTQRTELEDRAKAALWDGSRGSKDRKATRDAGRMVKNAESGADSRTVRKRRDLVPLPIGEFTRRLDKKLRAHADRMRARLLEAKRRHGVGSRRFSAALGAYNKWYAIAKPYLEKSSKKVAEYYDPAKVKDEDSRGRVVTKRRGGGGGGCKEWKIISGGRKKCVAY